MKPFRDELRQGDRQGADFRPEPEAGREDRIRLLEALADAATDAEALVVLVARAFTASPPRADREELAAAVAALDRAEAALRVANRAPKGPGGRSGFSGFSVDTSPE